MSRNHLLALLLLAAGPAGAATFTVGSDPWCSNPTLASAINQATVTSGGPHEIRINAGEFGGQALVVQDIGLRLIGGYQNCGTGAPRIGRSVLVGTGSEAVLRVRNGTAQIHAVELTGLELRNGGGGADGYGGGIDATGAFLLRLTDVIVAHNGATLGGGGIHAQGPVSGFGGIVELLQGTRVNHNTVPRSGETRGGGIHLERATLRVRSDDVEISGNQAGLGGGIAARSNSGVFFGNFGLPEVSDNALGARLSHNQARVGGGAWLSGSGVLFDARELAIDHNVADDRGGGIYADAGAQVQLQRDYPNAFRAQCAGDASCSRMVGNRAGNGCPGTTGQGGALYLLRANAFIAQTVFRDNCAYGAPVATSFGPLFVMEGVELSGNLLRFRDTIEYTGDRTITFGSRLGDPDWQPRISHLTAWGNRSIDAAGNAVPSTVIDSPRAAVAVTVAASAFDAGASPSVLASGPCNRSGLAAEAYVDVAAGDFRPAALGGLVDACAVGTVATDYRDPRLTPRCIDIETPDVGGTCDIGAHEAPTVLAPRPEATSVSVVAFHHPTPLRPATPVEVEVAVDGQRSRPATATVSVQADTGEGCSSAVLVPAGATRVLARCTLAFAEAGTRTLAVVYHGALTHAPATTSAALVVDPLESSVQIVARTPQLAAVGDTYTFGILVAGSGTVGGTVTVDAGAAGACTAPVFAGGALCELLALAAGEHAVSVHYSGDAVNPPASALGYRLPVHGEVDLSVTIDNGGRRVRDGGWVVYEVGVANAGPDTAFSARLEIESNTMLIAPQWECEAAPPVACDAVVQGPFDRTVTLPAGTQVRYRLAVLLGAGDAPLVTSATVQPAIDGSDVAPGNNFAVDGPDLRLLFDDSFEQRGEP
jgi:hypothetical protein